jgi:hypothetical protein
MLDGSKTNAEHRGGTVRSSDEGCNGAGAKGLYCLSFEQKINHNLGGIIMGEAKPFSYLKEWFEQ